MIAKGYSVQCTEQEGQRLIDIRGQEVAYHKLEIGSERFVAY